ncbi:MAG: transglutaminase-like domain-containing protein [Oscillospiraceae bacterium]|nr:transglutaminase-like domain-containing protein [Oscillospiraceae bacterium]
MAKNAKHAITVVGSFILILTAVACTFGAVISAFSFEVDRWLLLFVWLFITLALSIVATIWRGKGMLALILPMLALVFWKLPEISEGAKWAIFFISREFNKWLVVPIFFSGTVASTYELTLFFAGAGVILAYPLAVAICLRRSAFLAVFLTVPIVFVTFILVHSQPNTWLLVGLVAVYLTLLISSALHSDDFQKRDAAIFPSLAIAILLLGLAYVIASPENYKREMSMDTIDSQLRAIATRVGMTQTKSGVGWPLSYLYEWRFDTKNVEISKAGTRVITDRDILEVVSSEAGTFYLRGYSMQLFDGDRWTVNSDTLPFSNEWVAMAYPNWIAENYLTHYSDEGLISIKRVSMAIDRIRDATVDIEYTPYYSSPFSLGALSALSSSISPYGSIYPHDSIYPQFTQQGSAFLYTEESILKIQHSFPEFRYNYEMFTAYISEAREAYTQIDDSTAIGLRELAREAGIDATAARETVVDKVAEYIRSSGRYTLSPYVIPDGEDFALYFLKESQQGYCIHFTTAAVLMLRALDIPARFTSGFFVTVPEDRVGRAFPVTDRNAHAWVEVFYDEAGWLPLEVTPAYPGSEIPGGRSHTPDDSGENSNSNGISNMPADKDREDAPSQTQGNGQKTDPLADGDDDNDQEKIKAMWKAILIMFYSCAAICAALLFLRRPLARMRRKKHFAQTDTNAAVIRAWRYITRLSGKKTPPEEIEELAYKARFSQHIISEEERAEMVSYAFGLCAERYLLSNIFGKFLLYVRGL